MNITILTLFPELFPGPFQVSLLKKAKEKNLFSLRVVNIRDFSQTPYKNVDDKPYGGQGGMILRVDVLARAIESVYTSQEYLICCSPRGKIFTQSIAQEIAKNCTDLIVLCGRYEGMDQRIFDYFPLEEISLGDFIMTGGEMAAYCFVDAILRLIPKVLPPQRTKQESFENHLLEHPHYTRPAVWQGLTVPNVLMSGHHHNIAQWKKEQAQQITFSRRPDLWDLYTKKKS